MERKDLNKNLKVITDKLVDLKETRSNDLFIYVTKDKYLSGHGYVNELATICEVVDCKKEINKIVATQTSFADTESIEAMKELGIEDTSIATKPKPVKIMGFPVKYWNDDLITRIDEIKSDKLIIDLENAKTVLESNLSEDDKFANAMDSISHLLD